MRIARWLAALAAAAGMSVAFAGEVFDIGTMRVERAGVQGTPVVLVPGLASGPWVWKDTIDALKDTHRVYAVTLAGFDGRPASASGDPTRGARNLEVVTIAPARHFVMLDQPQAFVAAVRKFVDSRTAAP